MKIAMPRKPPTPPMLKRNGPKSGEPTRMTPRPPVPPVSPRVKRELNPDLYHTVLRCAYRARSR